MPEREDALTEAAKRYILRRNLPWEVAVANGWYTSYRAYDDKPRLVIPATASDENVYWQARSLDPNEPGLRYTSPPSPRGDAIVVVWPQVDGGERACVVAEGPMDALAAAGEGYVGVGLMGASPPLVALKLVAKMMKGLDVICVMDEDQPEGMTRVMRYLADFGMRVTLCRPYPLKDLAQATPAQRMVILAGLVKK